MKRTEPRPQFLGIEWDVVDEASRETVRVTARLCRGHREDVTREHPEARGTGELGDSCALCDGRAPTVLARLPADGPNGLPLGVRMAPAIRRPK